MQCRHFSVGMEIVEKIKGRLRTKKMFRFSYLFLQTKGLCTGNNKIKKLPVLLLCISDCSLSALPVVLKFAQNLYFY